MSPEKQHLEQQLWKIADTLRGKMDADDFRDRLYSAHGPNYNVQPKNVRAIRLSSTGTVSKDEK